MTVDTTHSNRKCRS